MNLILQSKALFTMITASLAFLLYASWPFQEDVTETFETETPQVRDLSETILASGYIQALNQLKVGSFVAGICKSILVDENDIVLEGQLLCEVDTGIGDTNVRQAQGAYEGAVANLDFQTLTYRRQKELHDRQYVSDESFDQTENDFRDALSGVKSTQAAFDQAEMIYKNNNIYSPGSGVVTSVGIKKGERVVTDLEATVICEIAPDVTKMEAKLLVDERDIGHVKLGQKISLTVDAYPERRYESEISDISFSPKKTDTKLLSYSVKARIDNSDLILHPGMNTTAVIQVSQAPHVLTVSSRVFLIHEDEIRRVAKSIHYQVIPMTEEAKAAFMREYHTNEVQTVWLVEDSSFKQVPVLVGSNNGIFFEIKAGLSGNETLVANVIERGV
jgi:HlyD family secretion protein